MSAEVGEARAEVARVWRDYWRAHAVELGARPPAYLVEALVQTMRPESGQRVLEAGSGTGGLSCALASLGVHAHLLDIVPACVRRGARAPATIGVVGDLFALPYADGSFDCVFNSGVLEHFAEDDLARGLRAMARALKPGGRLVVLVPSARGVFYVAGKRRQEQEGRWEYGVEHPQTSLVPLAASLGLELLEERLIGVRWQARFLEGWRRTLADCLLAPFSETSRVGAALFGGYLLLSSWRKPEAA